MNSHPRLQARPDPFRVLRSWLLLVVSITLAAALLWAAPASALELSVGSTSLTVSGLAAGGEAVVWGISRVGVGPIVREVRFEEIAVESSAEGTATIDLAESPAARSVWVAVDLASGETAVSYAPGYPASTLVLTGAESVSPEGFDQPGGFLEWLWVRPGSGATAGAWSAAIGDGGASDADGENDDSLRVAPTAFTPVSDRGLPPEALVAGDVLIAIEPTALSVGVMTVPSGALGSQAASGSTGPTGEGEER